MRGTWRARVLQIPTTYYIPSTFTTRTISTVPAQVLAPRAHLRRRLCRGALLCYKYDFYTTNSNSNSTSPRPNTSCAPQEALVRRRSRGYDSIARECDNINEWECAQQRVKNTGPQPMRVAGSERFRSDKIARKNIREGDDQDVNYRFPRGVAYPNRCVCWLCWWKGCSDSDSTST